ncbi:MAG: hypothetical protein FJ221_07430 [Lentisphaerae bacterium]|nr:hypothetical protein [Lentisphaerota bacterium]
MTTIRMAGWCAMTAAATWLAGCGGGEPPEAFAAREELRAQVGKLSRTVDDLRAEVETMRSERTTNLKAVVQDMLRTELDGMIATTVQARVESKIGDKAEIDRVFRESVADAMTAYEAKKKADEEARREQERVARDQERAKRDEERWTRVAQELGLNETQKEQMRAASQAIRQEIEAGWAQIRETGQPPDMDAMRRRAAELKAQFEASLAQSLTPQQIEAYRQQDFSLLRMLDGMASSSGGRGMMFGGRGGGDRGPDRSQGKQGN